MLSWMAEKSTALRVLIVELGYYSFHINHQDPAARYKNEWVYTLAQQLSASTLRLHAFSCRARDLNTFPVIPNLKHLMLVVRCDSLRSGVGSLSTLISLETLHLTGYGGSKAQWYRGSKPDSDAFDCPPLELSPLSCLRSLVLVNITAEGISVSSSCVVHVNLTGNHDVKHPVWSAICIDALGSVTWCDVNAFAWVETPQHIPMAMREASCLDCVRIYGVMQWSCEALPSALACVRILCISASRIIFCVPAKVQWQFLSLNGSNQLDVTFEDVDAFARMPMDFQFECFRSDQPFGREWLPLDAALVRNKPNWVSKCKQLEHRCQCADKCECGGGPECKCVCDEHDICELSYKQFPGHDEDLKFMGCPCGACIHCLEEDGKIVLE